MIKEMVSSEELVSVLTTCHGNIKDTADMLKQEYMTVYRYIKSSPEMTKIKNLLKEREIDFVETKLMKLIKTGDRTAIIFYLQTQGKSRGYCKESDKGTAVNPIIVKFVPCFGPDQGKEVPLNKIAATDTSDAEEAILITEQPKPLKKKKINLAHKIKKRILNVRTS